MSCETRNKKTCVKHFLKCINRVLSVSGDKTVGDTSPFNLYSSLDY